MSENGKLTPEDRERERANREPDPMFDWMVDAINRHHGENPPPMNP